MNPFRVTGPTGNSIPILLSVPHCGTFIPETIRNEYDDELITEMDDTDFFVDRLYDFAPSIGATLLAANISRWVIDLNRSPEDKPLYTDGRVITGLCPIIDFFGRPLYRDRRTAVSRKDVRQRLDEWYLPYHRELAKLRDGLLHEHGAVIIWECHSIRRSVPTIYPEDFPDLILGDAGGKSASARLSDSAMRLLGSDKYVLAHNQPFQGGYITRQYGDPIANCHALQLEMTKVNYLQDDEISWSEERSSAMKRLLEKTLLGLVVALKDVV